MLRKNNVTHRVVERIAEVCDCSSKSSFYSSNFFLLEKQYSCLSEKEIKIKVCHLIKIKAKRQRKNYTFLGKTMWNCNIFKLLSSICIVEFHIWAITSQKLKKGKTPCKRGVLPWHNCLFSAPAVKIKSLRQLNFFSVFYTRLSKSNKSPSTPGNFLQKLDPRWVHEKRPHWNWALRLFLLLSLHFP